MGFREWWYKKSFALKGLIVGFITGLLLYFVSYNTSEPLITLTWIISVKPFCDLLNFTYGEQCAFGYIFLGWLFSIIIFGLLGLILGYIIERLVK